MLLKLSENPDFEEEEDFEDFEKEQEIIIIIQKVEIEHLLYTQKSASRKKSEESEKSEKSVHQHKKK